MLQYTIYGTIGTLYSPLPRVRTQGIIQSIQRERELKLRAETIHKPFVVVCVFSGAVPFWFLLAPVIVSACVLQTLLRLIVIEYWKIIHFFLYLFTFLFIFTKKNEVLQTSIHFSITFLFLTTIACRCANHGPKSTSEQSKVSVWNFTIRIIEPNARKG